MRKQYLAPLAARSTNTAIIATMHIINTVLNDIICRDLDWHENPSRYAIECAQKTQQCLYDIITKLDSPGDYFPFIAHGSYKECYSSWIDGWVVKFCTVANDSGAEQHILRAAQDYKVQDLFLPSHYITLPVWVDASRIMEDDCCEEDEYCEMYPEPMNTIVFQPEVEVEDDRTYTVLDSAWREIYYQRPLTHNYESLPFGAINGVDIESLSWLQAVLDYHGIDTFRRFIQFTRDFKFSDLSAANTGYYEMPNGKEKPVILDWLSSPILK